MGNDTLVTMSYQEDRARAQYEYEFGQQDRAELEEEERRDYKAEALGIAAGTSMLLTERAHVIALAEYIAAIEADLQYVRKQNAMLRNAHPAFVAVRKSAGRVEITKEEVA